ncbi:response regulator [Pseudobdellovibrio sp. HCB154]|uniref:response regulator n=1 Tax=Pseudobdellovibrio sp. HCB154 TaxID=3386277 RepID=UPI003917280F
MPTVRPFTQNHEVLEFLEIFLDEIHNINVEFSKAEKSKNISSLQNISRVIHSIKGSAGVGELNFAPVLCHNIEEALLKIKENGFTPEQSELTSNLFALLEDYFNAKKKEPECEDDAFAVRMYSLLGKVDTKKAGQSLAGLRGLIVDDSNIVIKKIATALSEEGVFCSRASNGLEALNRLTDEYFDFVVAGHSLKKINGFELIEMLNISKGKNPHLKTCLISSAENLTPLKKTANLVLQKNAFLIQNLNAFLHKEFKGLLNKQPTKSFKKILLVDDDPVIRILLHAVFKTESDLQVEIVASGAEALNKVQKFTPDVIVLDCIMPEFSGEETFKALKLLTQLKETRFFFLTGKTRPAELAELQSLGVDGIIVKPFMPDRLVHTLKEKYSKAANGEVG